MCFDATMAVARGPPASLPPHLESSMNTAIKPAKKLVRKERPVLVSCVAAQMLGRTRVSGTDKFTARDMTTAFPAFNAFEVTRAIGELVEKQLVTQRGAEERATYLLTDRGRTGRVGVS
jgi:CobQ-like glutamine amidotransferase family enzyme